MMTSYYVRVTSKFLSKSELICTPSCENLVAIALAILEIHRRGFQSLPPPPPSVPEGPKKPVLNRVKPHLTAPRLHVKRSFSLPQVSGVPHLPGVPHCSSKDSRGFGLLKYRGSLVRDDNIRTPLDIFKLN